MDFKVTMKSVYRAGQPVTQMRSRQ